MSTARFIFPKLRLADLLKTPGGLTVAEALARAHAGLDTLKPACLAELTALLGDAEAAYAGLGDAFDDTRLAGLYAIAVRGIGVGAVYGAPAVDEALTSLCDLLDHLRTRGRGDREAIAVHLRAWRLLMNPDLPAAEARPVLEGLRKVAARHAPA